MDIIQKGIQNWQDGKRIEDYCSSHGYSSKDTLALREIHRLHLEESSGTLGGTPQEALEVIAQATPAQKQLLKSIGQKTNPRLCDALIRLAENQPYTNKILSFYQSDIKPNLQL